MVTSYDDKNECELTIGINKLGIGVAMNNTVPATPSSATITPANTNVNNIHLDDVQKLQQQLQDIKEQVNFQISNFIFPIKTKIHDILSLLTCRQCVQYVSIESKIWYFFVAMVRVKCVVIKSMVVQFAVKLSKSEFCSFKILLGEKNKQFLHTYSYFKCIAH